MGTNYYARHIPTWEEHRKNLKRMLNKTNDGELQDIIEKHFNDNSPREIHIGKSSVGWKFLFNHNNWEYFKDIKSLKSFLLNCKIVDEYDGEISYDDFWKLVKFKKNGHDGKSYYEEHPSKKDIDLYRNNLRFSTSTSFC